MSAVSVVLRPRPRKDGTFSVAIRIYAAGKTSYEYSGYSVRRDQFRDKSGKWVYGHPDSALINAKINSIRKASLTRLDEEAGYIKTRTTDLHNFSDYLLDRAAAFKADDNIDMYRRCNLYEKEIRQMAGRKVFAEEITPEWVRRHVAYLKSNGNCQNTAMGKIKRLRTLYKQAIQDGRASAPNPFETYNIHYDPTSKEKLTIEEIHSLEKLHLEGVNDLARDCFLFAFYCHGMRFGSVFKLRWDQISNGYVTYQMDKGKKFRSVKIRNTAQAILSKYAIRQQNGEKRVFPLMKREPRDREDYLNMKGSANALINAALKHVAALAGITTPVSTHIARHSFAYALKKKRVDMHVIKDALGHGSMDMTEQYLQDLDDDEINDAVDGAIGE